MIPGYIMPLIIGFVVGFFVGYEKRHRDSMRHLRQRLAEMDQFQSDWLAAARELYKRKGDT